MEPIASRLYPFLCGHEQTGTDFSADEAAAATGSKATSITTYISKKLKGHYLFPVPGQPGRYSVRGITSISADAFTMLLTQKGLPLAASPLLQLPTARPTPPADSITPTYFTSLHVDGLTLDTAIDFYLSWIEGSGQFSGRDTATRRDQGVPQPLDRDSLWSGKPQGTSASCEVIARRDGGTAILRFVHGDAADARVSWWSIASLAAYSTPRAGVHIRHATGRVSVGGPGGPSSTGVPKVLRAVLDQRGHTVRERDADSVHPRRVAGSDVGHYVKHELLDVGRTLPHVVVSLDPATGKPLVNPGKLVKLLRTQVVVYVLDLDATRELEATLERAGFDAELGSCYGGAVRLYLPNVAQDRNPRSHYLWLPYYFNRFDTGAAVDPADRLASQIASKLVWRSLPPRFLHTVEDWDRRELHVRIAAVLAHSTGAVEVNLAADLQNLRDALSRAQDEREQIESQRDELDTRFRGAKADAEMWQQYAEVREAELDAEKQTNFQLRSKLIAFEDGLGGNGVAAHSQRVDRDGVADLFGAPPSLERALNVVSLLYSDRVNVLDSAFRSAKEASGFQNPQKALELMLKLCTDYWNKLQHGGKGDAEARQVFGDCYSAKEAGLSNGGTDARTFDFNGTRLFMDRHLKIGFKDSPAACWRLHFHWDPDCGKFVVGHCGRHLPL